MTVHQENFVATKEYESQYLSLCDKPQCSVRRHTLSALQSLTHQLIPGQSILSHADFSFSHVKSSLTKP